MGAPTWPPNPQTFAAPRRSRGASLEWLTSWGGPDMAPKPPNVRSAPAEPWRFSGVVDVVGGPRHGPPNPQTFAAPRRSRGASLEWLTSWGGPDMAPKPPNLPSAPPAPGPVSDVVKLS